MKTHGVIHVTQVHNLESDDLFAFETAGRLASGKVKGVFYSAYDLTEEAREYMTAKANLEIPANRFASLGGASQVFVLFEPKPFSGFANTEGQLDHIFLSLEDMLAIFEYDRARSFTEIPECAE